MKANVIKRLASLALVLALLCGIVPTVLAEGASLANFKKINTYTPGQFTDVPTDQWYNEYVAASYEYGLVKGTSPTTYSPNSNITIGQALALAARLHAIYHNGFEDFVQGDPWFLVYMKYDEDNGIVPRGEYIDGGLTATRAQFASILAGALPDEALPAINDYSYGDLPDVFGDESYGPAVYRLYNAGVLTGNDGYGTFAPGKYIRRSEVAAIITRLADVSLRKTFELVPKQDENKLIDILVGTVLSYGGLEEEGVYTCQISEYQEDETGFSYYTYLVYDPIGDTVSLAAMSGVYIDGHAVLWQLGVPLSRATNAPLKGSFQTRLDRKLVDEGAFLLSPEKYGTTASIAMTARSAGSTEDPDLTGLLSTFSNTMVSDVERFVLDGTGYSLRDYGFPLY